MKVVLSRIDERLIHGQVLISWVKRLSLEQIIVVDDNLVQEYLVQSAMRMTVPPDIRVVFLSVKEASEYLWKEDTGVGRNTVLLFRDVRTVAQLVKSGYHMRSLNVGFIATRDQRRKLTEYVYVSEEELALLRELMAAGVEIYLQIVHAEPRISLETLMD